MNNPTEELLEAARIYSEAVDAWNATAEAPREDRNRLNAEAFRFQEAKLKALGQAARKLYRPRASRTTK